MDRSIIADLKNSYGVVCDQITPVTGGLLNLKWRVSTEKGELLVKQYSHKRFSREKLERIEYSLKRQVILEKNGVSCPVIWQHGDRVIRWLDDKTAYMIMNFCEGKTEKVNAITLKQMRSLGTTCAIMHKSFSQLLEPSVKNLLVFGGYSMELLWDNFNSCMGKCSQDMHIEYRKALFAMEPILKELSTEFFERLPKGLCHEDFHSGNILFHEDCVSAILDFDRNCYSYIWHDIGRAILSFALEGNIMNVDKVYSFLEGYSQHLQLTLMNIGDALRLSWCIETPWWIQPEFFSECDEVPKRFKDEMLWLTEHWFEIDSLLCPNKHG